MEKPNEKVILSIDLGYGDCKIALGTKTELLKKFKFPTMIGVTKKINDVQDLRIKEYDGYHYYVGENAKHLPSENLIDMSEYKNLEYYAPLLINHAVEMCEIQPDILISGLSIAQLNNSAAFQKKITSFEVDGKQHNYEVYLLPQGSGAKLFIDNYFDNFPVKNQTYLGNSTYVIGDLGFNTIDLILVDRGKTSPSLFQGIEREGMLKIATLVAKFIKEKHDRNITLGEAKQIIDTKTYRLRGKSYDYSAEILSIKRDYLKGVLALIEEKFPSILDKCDFVFLCGGGSTIFETGDNNFIKVPKNSHEFYNAIGWWTYGTTKV